MPHCTLGEEIRDGRRQQVRRAVPVERERFGALIRHDADRRVVFEREGQVDELPVHDSGQGGLREARRDQFRHVADARACGQLPTGSIGKRDGDLTHESIVDGVLRLASLAQGILLSEGLP